jgi:hypothetical protein
MPEPDPSPPAMSMAPPPAGEFGTREELLEYLKDWAESQGFAVVIGRSRKNRLWIKCDRGGEYSDKHLNDPENRKRKRKETRLTGCPFMVKSTQKKDGIWRCYTETGEHNHGPSEDLTVHPSLRRMTDEQIQKVNEMTEANNTPVETLEELQRLWPGIKVLRRDIYNARKKYKTEKELADVAQGLNLTRPYEDPNEKMSGPTLTGRWEWLEEGDEIKRKKKRKVSGSTQLNIAPELRDATVPPMPQLPTRRQAPGLGSVAPRPFQQAQPIPAQQQQQQQQQQQRAQATLGAMEPDVNGNALSSPASFRHYNPSASLTPVGHPGVAAAARPVFRPTPQMGPVDGGLMGQASRAGIPESGPVASGPRATAATGQTGANGQVLMSRIERMEKEQREQKTMLAQILGAIQGKQAQGQRR